MAESTPIVAAHPSASPTTATANKPASSPLPNWLHWTGPLLELGYSCGQKLHRSFSHPIFAPITTLCAGNLTAGGTGKTPAVKYLAHLLHQRGRKVAVLMRGYKGQSADEAAEMRAALDPIHAPLFVDPDRLASAKLAAVHGCDTVILDDGFQHWRLARDLDIALIDALNPFGGGHLLPRGFLRERPEDALPRAHIVVLSRSDAVSAGDLDSLSNAITRMAPNAVQVRALHKPSRLTNCVSSEAIDLSKLAGLPVLAVCAIGNPNGFRHTLNGLGANLLDFVALPDHYLYTSETVRSLESRAAAVGATAIVTTEKDSAKLSALCGSMKIQVLNLAIDFEIVGDPTQFLTALEKGLARGDQRVKACTPA